jgi:TrmH family RNA methyltransferase
MTINRQLNTDELAKRQEQAYKLAESKPGPIIIAEDIHTPENMASILRVADGAGSRRVIFVNQKQPVLSKKMTRIARNVENYLDLKFVSLDAYIALSDSLPERYALEITAQSKNILNSLLPNQISIVIGNERHGISDAVLNTCQSSIHIPMYGKKSSMNVSHALAICLYEWRRQQS